MRFPRSLSAIALLLLPTLIGVASAVACTNVTISNSADADEVRRNCKVISGDLILAPDLAEDVNLDGVETILGSISHDGCEDGFEACPSLSPFVISSSTLSTVNGSITFLYFNGLKELSFPNLTLVQEGFSLKRMHYLELLDITKLTQVGSLLVEAANLTTLWHEKLETFTEANGPGSVQFWAAAVDSVDSFYSAPIKVNGGNSFQSILSLSSYDLPNVRSLTIGWAKIREIWIVGDDLKVTLGASNTTSMEIGSLELKGNITTFERASSLKNLTVSEFNFKYSEPTAELELPFDQVSSLSIIDNPNLQKIKLPAAALNWTDFDLGIIACPNLTLDSQYQNVSDDGSQEQIWYWPQKDMQSIMILDAAISDNFFESFLQYNAVGSNFTNPPKVLKTFDIDPNEVLSFNCTPFNELHDRGVLPSDYSCVDVTSSATHGLAAQKLSIAAIALMVTCWVWI